MYKLTVEANNTAYKSEGKTVEEALANTGVSYLDIKTKGFVTFEKSFKEGKKTKKMSIKKFFVFKQLRRLFANTLFQRQWMAQMEKNFDVMKVRGVKYKEMFEL